MKEDEKEMEEDEEEVKSQATFNKTKRTIRFKLSLFLI